MKVIYTPKAVIGTWGESRPINSLFTTLAFKAPNEVIASGMKSSLHTDGFLWSFDMNSHTETQLGQITDLTGFALAPNRGKVVMTNKNKMYSYDISLLVPCKDFMTDAMQQIPVDQDGKLQVYKKYSNGIETQSGTWNLTAYRRIRSVEGNNFLEKNMACFSTGDTNKQCCVTKGAKSGTLVDYNLVQHPLNQTWKLQTKPASRILLEDRLLQF